MECAIYKRIVRHKPKFVGYLRKYKGNCARCVDKFFHICQLHACFLHFLNFFNMDWSMFVECALKLWSILYPSHICEKLIYHMPSANCMLITQCNQGTHVCTRLLHMIYDAYRETIPKVRKMRTLLYGICDRGSIPEYFETFLRLLGAELIEIGQFEITSEKK